MQYDVKEMQEAYIVQYLNNYLKSKCTCTLQWNVQCLSTCIPKKFIVTGQALERIFKIYWSFGLEGKIEVCDGHECGHDRCHDRLDTCGRIYRDDMP